jgi:glutathione-regulated potassium-efflux system protein KefB
MEWAGLSMALGAFLLGMLLSGAKFKHRLEEIVSSLKLALLDLFFIAVGMSMDLRILAHAGWFMILRVIFIASVESVASVSGQLSAKRPVFANSSES